MNNCVVAKVPDTNHPFVVNDDFHLAQKPMDCYTM